MGGPLFRFEWQATGDGVRAAELAATWARLEVSCETGPPLTVVEDLQGGSIRRSIYVSLYSLAEWIAFNWWGLLFGSRKGPWSERNSDAASDLTESGANRLRSAGDGFLWPDLSIEADGDGTLLSWREDGIAHPGWPIKFLTSGTALVDTSWLRDSLVEVVESTLTRLDEAGLEATTLHKEWSVLQGLDPEEVEFCQACGRLGLDPFADGHDFAKSIDVAFQKVDGPNRDDLFDAVRASDLEPWLEWVDTAGSRAESALAEHPAPKSWPDWAALGGELQDGTLAGPERPYQMGYRQAVRTRRALGRAETDPIHQEGLPFVQAGAVPSPSRSLHGLAVSSPQRDQACLVLGSRQRAEGQLFASARCLWSLLFEPGEQCYLLTASRSRRQQASRAFAAELLAPAEGIRELLGDPNVSVPDHFGVSETVIERQIENQLWLRRPGAR
ncbi:MAG: ImmA/IrrE family metallo-endopeptidase [Acidimicrobiales bacterium]